MPPPAFQCHHAPPQHGCRRRFPKLLWLNLEQRTRTTVGCLVGFGISDGGLRRVLTHAPRILAQTLPQINTRYNFVQRVLGGSVQVCKWKSAPCGLMHDRRFVVLPAGLRPRMGASLRVLLRITLTRKSSCVYAGSGAHACSAGARCASALLWFLKHITRSRRPSPCAFIGLVPAETVSWPCCPWSLDAHQVQAAVIKGGPSAAWEACARLAWLPPFI